MLKVNCSSSSWTSIQNNLFLEVHRNVIGIQSLLNVYKKGGDTDGIHVIFESVGECLIAIEF
jgi:hypothetical protein